jgi:heme-degrading monooxygenase HmoA
MIVRRWAAQAAGATGYLAHFRRRVLPVLRQISGFRGAMVLRRVAPDEIDIEVMTFWSSMGAIRRFAGHHADRAVVEPEAKTTLRRFDRKVRHFELILDAGSDSPNTLKRRPPLSKRNRTRAR